MKRKVFIFALAILFLGLSYFSMSYTKSTANLSSGNDIVNGCEGQQVEIVKFDKAKEEIDNSNIIFGDASYLDYSESLSKIKSDADLIIAGRVVEQEQFSPISVKSKVEVIETFKGKKSDIIYVYQLGNMGDKEILDLSSEYFLLLGKQTDDKEDTFFIKGGVQGLFKKDNDKLINYDQFMRKELQRIKQNKNYKNEVEAFTDFIKAK